MTGHWGGDEIGRVTGGGEGVCNWMEPVMEQQNWLVASYCRRGGVDQYSNVTLQT
jgi:hypothetical protein